MRNPVIRTGILIVLGLAAILIYMSLFTVHQTQQAVVLRFGAVRQVITEPGLYMKAPFVDVVLPVEKRVLDLNIPAQTVLSSDRQNLRRSMHSPAIASLMALRFLPDCEQPDQCRCAASVLRQRCDA